MSRDVASLPHQLTSKRAIPKKIVAIAIGPADQQLADQHGDAEPHRCDPVDDDRDQGDDEQQPVDGRVELLAELADLAEPPGEVAVDPVGGAEPAEQPRRGGAVVPSEQQVEEQRQAQQPESVNRLGTVRSVSTSPAGSLAPAVRRRAVAHARRSAHGDCRTRSVAGMTTLFSRIIDGEIPGTFVWRDDRCVAFLSINPLAPGHTLVVPIAEVDHWVDGPPDLIAHLFEVTRVIGVAQREAFRCRAGRRDHRRLRGAARCTST